MPSKCAPSKIGGADHHWLHIISESMMLGSSHFGDFHSYHGVDPLDFTDKLYRIHETNSGAIE